MNPRFVHFPILILLCIEILVATAFSSNKPPVQWLIVGGGPHGVHIATRLLEEVPSISHSDICIIDNEPTLLQKWKTRTAATGMVYLRSSSSYHLDVREDGLKRFNKQRWRNNKHLQLPLFAADYQRPRLDLFNEHCDHVIAKNHLDQVHMQGKVTDVTPTETHVEVEFGQPTGDTIKTCANNVVLALGSDDPAYPDWATDEMIQSGQVKHIFDENDNNWSTHHRQYESIAIVGGGISAAHLALKLHNNLHGNSNCTSIHMISRHDFREKQFDTHQDWMMDSLAAQRSEAGGGQGIPMCQHRFASLDSFVERRDVITRERQGGTISAAVLRGKGGLRYAIEGGHIHWHKDDICSVTNDAEMLSLVMESGEHIAVDQIILATGFNKLPPANSLIKTIAQRNGLTLCPCGYPAPDKSLRWHQHIYLAGALAELELGPSARNLAGARLASERIVAAAKSATASSRNTAGSARFTRSIA